MRIISTLLFILALLAGPVHAQDDDDFGSSRYSITVNTSLYEMTPKSFKKSAMYAFAYRNWDVTQVDENKVSGTLIGKNGINVEIARSGDTVVIRFLQSQGRENWLKNLRGPFLQGLLLFGE